MVGCEYDTPRTMRHFFNQVFRFVILLETDGEP